VREELHRKQFVIAVEALGRIGTGRERVKTFLILQMGDVLIAARLYPWGLPLSGTEQSITGLKGKRKQA
jgi:hypothetical protein